MLRSLSCICSGFGATRAIAHVIDFKVAQWHKMQQLAFSVGQGDARLLHSQAADLQQQIPQQQQQAQPEPEQQQQQQAEPQPEQQAQQQLQQQTQLQHPLGPADISKGQLLHFIKDHWQWHEKKEFMIVRRALALSLAEQANPGDVLDAPVNPDITDYTITYGDAGTLMEQALERELNWTRGQPKGYSKILVAFRGDPFLRPKTKKVRYGIHRLQLDINYICQAVGLSLEASCSNMQELEQRILAVKETTKPVKPLEPIKLYYEPGTKLPQLPKYFMVPVVKKPRKRMYNARSQQKYSQRDEELDHYFRYVPIRWLHE